MRLQPRLQTDHKYGYLHQYVLESLDIMLEVHIIMKNTHTDVNECANSSMHNCSEAINEVCQDMEGSYECICKPGFEMDEGVCKGEFSKS